MLVCLLKAMTEHSAYNGKSFGAISLLGDEQAELIQTLSLQLLGAVELTSRRFAAGNAPQFQGDERDSILLSMVDVSTGTPLRIRQEPSFKQRYNVAASRVRELERLGIRPATTVPDRTASAGAELQEVIERRAWEIMREQEWVPSTNL